MEDDGYKTEMRAMAQHIVEQKAKYGISDLRNLNFTISIALQEWTAKEIFSKLLQSQLEKVALVVSADFFTQLSVEQTMNENTVNTFQNRCFKRVDDSMGFRIIEKY